MKTNITYFLYVLLITICACNSKSKTHNHKKSGVDSLVSKELVYAGCDSIIQINTDQIEQITYTDFSQKICNVRYIPLKTSEPIGVIEKIIMYEDKIYVLDAQKAECIFIFDMKGNLLRILNDKGRGPKEYLGLEDMNIDKVRRELIINDRLMGGLLHFTLDGDFVKKSKSCPKSDFFVKNGIVTSHITQSLSDKGEFQVAVSVEDSILLRGFPIYPIRRQQGASRIFFMGNCDQVLCIPPSSDTIYQFISDSVYQAKYVLNHHKSIWEYKDIELTSKEYNNLIKTSGYSSIYGTLLEVDSLLYFSMEKSENGILLIKSYFYDKKEEKTYEVLENKIDVNGILPHKPIAVYENSVCGIVQSYFLEAVKNVLDTCSFQKNRLNEDVKNVLQHWKMESDPVLVLYEFK